MLPGAVEPVLRELVVRDQVPDLLPFTADRCGRYWSSTAALDLVCFDRERKRALVGEIQWSHRPVSPALLDGLKRRVAGEAAFEGLDVTYALFSRAGFDSPRAAARDERLIDIGGLMWRS